MPLVAIDCPSAYAVDGDKLRCGSIRLASGGTSMRQNAFSADGKSNA